MARQPKNFIKLGLVLLFLFWFFSPTIIFALDQRCWEKDKCTAPEVAGAFYGPNDETITACGGEKNASGEELGFCKPPYVANTEIDFGGRTSFENIGVFIKYMFRYSVMAAGILSVIMIMFAGFEWVTSGGNSEKISGAKKKISGAIMGLLIASFAYVLLGTINPYLVNLRLPQAWMVNSQGLAPVYCNELKPDTAKVAYAFGSEEKISNADKEKQFKALSNENYNIEALKGECNNEYFVKDAGGQTCSGTYCGSDAKVCVFKESGVGYQCIDGNIAGSIIYTPLIHASCYPGLEGWEGPPTDISETELWAVCSDGDTTDVMYGSYPSISKDIDDKTQFFSIRADFSKIESAEQSCKNKGKKFKGMVLMFEMNEDCDPADEEHLIGRNGTDLGDEGWTDEYNKKLTGKDTGFASNISSVKDYYFYTTEELKKGVRADIDAAKVHDIDSSDERSIYKSLLE